MVTYNDKQVHVLQAEAAIIRERRVRVLQRYLDSLHQVDGVDGVVAECWRRAAVPLQLSPADIKARVERVSPNTRQRLFCRWE